MAGGLTEDRALRSLTGTIPGLTFVMAGLMTPVNPLKGVRRRLHDMWHGPTEAAEFMSGVIALWWAGLLASPGFSFSSNPSFSAFETWGTEAGWSVFCGGVGLLQIGALVMDHSQFRRLSSGLAAGLWIAVTGAIVVANPWSTGVGNYLVIALATAWASLRKEDPHADAGGA